ncbi:hypothetical protein OUZ56_021432 [Daphnia magna]|uniref:Uncharacterized protein n=1 Tax=Daphnia magna TaxID=35525 RepID=A0ABQ9ZHC8_9CRUS|nr:hypothetical protein OUZ56_021432 [Daphnia magna]
MTQDQEGPYSIVTAHYDATVSELENQIASLQQEKEELASLLAQVSGNANACKKIRAAKEVVPGTRTANQRIQEQERTEESSMKNFNNDIQAMQAQQVKLVRQMREENQKFMTCRQQKDREVARL